MTIYKPSNTKHFKEITYDIQILDENRKLKFANSPLKDRMFATRTSMNPLVKLAMRENITETFLKDLDFRLGSQKNIILTGYGDTGIGKSTIGTAIGWYINEKSNELFADELVSAHGRTASFSADNICFTRTELLQMTPACIRGEALVLDEDVRGINTGLGSKREQEEMQKLEKQVRADQINFIFLAPPDTNEHVSHYKFEAIDVDYKNGVNRWLLWSLDSAGMNIPVGYCLTPNIIIDGYLDKKMDYIKKLKDRSSTGRSRELLDVTKAIYKKLSKSKIKKTALKSYIGLKHPNYTTKEVDSIVGYYDLLRDKLIEPDELVPDETVGE